MDFFDDDATGSPQVPIVAMTIGALLYILLQATFIAAVDPAHVAKDWSVTVPTFRARDVTREIDLVEEIARVHLDEVPFALNDRPRQTLGWMKPCEKLKALVAMTD